MLASFSNTFNRCIGQQSSTLARNCHTTTMVNQKLDNSNIIQMLAMYDTFLLDCDGVIWGDDHITPIPGVSETISTLRKMGKRVLFVTNNSIHGRESYLEKFRTMAGFDANKDEVFSVAYAAAVYLKDVAPITGRCYLIGNVGLAQELDEAGIPHVGVGPDPNPPTGNPKKLLEMDLAQDIGAVLVGFDAQFNYSKMFKAASYLSSPDCMYVATNDVETRVHIAPGRRQPIAGAFTAAVSAASGRQPTVLGKPYRYLLDCIRTKFPDLDPSRTLMVGDSLKTDIPFATKNGMDSMLVLTGVSQMKNVNNLRDNSFCPTYITNSLADIAEFYNSEGMKK